MSCKRQNGKVYALRREEERFHVLLQKARAERGERASSGSRSSAGGWKAGGDVKPGQRQTSFTANRAKQMINQLILSTYRERLE